MKEKAIRFMPWGIVAVLLALAVWSGGRRAWSAISNHSAFTLRTVTMTRDSCPPSVRARPMLAEIRDQLGTLLGRAQTLDPELCSRVRESLLRCPWVLEVKSIRRNLPDGLKVEVRFRTPAGLLTLGDTTHLVDLHGHVLPGQLYRQPENWSKAHMPVIVDRDLRSYPGEGPNGKGIRAGAHLTQFLLKENLLHTLKIETMDVTAVGEPGDGSDITMVTDGGVVIKWGSCEAYDTIRGLDRPDSEPTDAQKLRGLHTRLRQFPRLKGLRYLDLRYHNKTYLEPSLEARTSGR